MSMFDAADAVGVADSPSDAPSAEVDTTESAVEDTAGATTPETPVSTTSSDDGEPVTDIDSGDEQDSPDTEPEVDKFDPSDVASKVDFEALTDDQKREVLRSFAELNATPQWARDKLIPSLKLFDSAIKDKQTVEQQVADMRAQYEGKEALNPDVIARYKEQEETLLGLRSITAKPDDIHALLQKQNPRVYDEFVADTAWKSFENPDGTPNMDNFQRIVDKFTGEAGKVDAKDVFQAVKALEDGDLEAAELYGFRTDEEQKDYETSKAERAAATADRMEAKRMRDSTEESYRVGLTNTYAKQVQEQLRTSLTGTMEKFKLGSVENEPAPLQGIKTFIRENIAGKVQRFMTENPHLKEVDKAMKFLQSAQGMTTDEAEREVRAYLDSEAYQSTLSAGLKALDDDAENQIAQASKFYAWAAKGYEVMEKERLKNAKPTPGKSGQMINTQEDIDTTGMTPNQINAENNKRLSRQAYSWSEEARSANRLGG